jgi:hypothetical protein
VESGLSHRGFGSFSYSPYSVYLCGKKSRRADSNRFPAHYECAVRGCRGVQGVANPAFLSDFLCSGLLGVAPYCVPGGIRVVSGVREYPRQLLPLELVRLWTRDPSHIDEKAQGWDRGHLPRRTRTDLPRTSRGVRRTSGLSHSPPPQRVTHWSTRHL